MDPITCGAHDLGHVRPDIIVIIAVKISPVTRTAHRDLSLFGLLQDRSDSGRCVSLITQILKLFAHLHAQCFPGAAMDTGKTVAATILFRVGHYSGIILSADMTVINAGFDTGAAVDTAIVAEDNVGCYDRVA